MTLTETKSADDAARLVGTYEVAISKADVLARMPDPRMACENAGTFVFTFTATRWQFWQTPLPDCTIIGTDSIQGTWRVEGHQIFFHADEEWGCPQDDVFEWQLDGGALSFKPVGEGCPPRLVILCSHPLQRRD